ncbi:unnamed protein product [Urochloa decumbens]|uniref:Uncharacterized protein n=1 Tax=Urochloa decumbens TaxID=240449 RepID=A0ABC9D211_9POAL
MSTTEAAIRRAGAAVAGAAASALMRVPAPEAHEHVVLALHALFLFGCAAVQLAPAHRAAACLARRAAEEAARGIALGASAAGLRWVGFGCVLLYAIYVAGDDVRAEAEASSVDKVKDLLLFLVFLTAVWAVYLSMVTGRGVPQPRPEEEDDELRGGEVDAMAPRPARVLVD